MRRAYGALVRLLCAFSAISAHADWTSLDKSARAHQAEQQEYWDSSQRLVTASGVWTTNCKERTTAGVTATDSKSRALEQQIIDACNTMKKEILPCLNWDGKKSADSGACLNAYDDTRKEYKAYEAAKTAAQGSAGQTATEAADAAADGEIADEVAADAAEDALEKGTDAATQSHKSKLAELRKKFRESLTGKSRAERKALRAQYRKDRAKLKSGRTATGDGTKTGLLRKLFKKDGMKTEIAADSAATTATESKKKNRGKAILDVIKKKATKKTE